MSTIAEKLERLSQTKQYIREAIINKGVDIPDGTPFADYPDKIMQIEGGGDTDYIEIEGIRWAKSNLIADPADNTGMTSMFAGAQDMYTGFYQWGRKKAWAPSGSVSGWDNTSYEGDSWLPENDPSPDGWRLPTKEELQALISSSSTWRAAGSSAGNTVAGRFFGYNRETATMADLKGCLFLPAAGYRYGSNGTLYEQGVTGGYWTSSMLGSIYAYFLLFTNAGINMSSGNGLNRGYCLRCVKV